MGLSPRPGTRWIMSSPLTTKRTLDWLQRYESRNVTWMAGDGSWPIVWERARGIWVWDAEGKRYLDLTAAFGVAAAGHANPAVVNAGRAQMGRLLHAMGDVHPHGLKAALARELSRITFERWTQTPNKLSGKTIFCNSGFEAVEAALKTAFVATGKAKVIAFEGAYHGLGYGALNATHRRLFRSPFRRQLAEFCDFVPFGVEEAEPGAARILERIESMLGSHQFGAVLIEPVQARGGIRVPATGFLPALRKLCTEHETLLILDEIYTGFGRTGKWFACEREGVIPDIICLGKALTGGFPLSACVGRGDVMDAAWPPSEGEAIHTSTFLGHPVGCAMAIAQIREIENRRLVETSATMGEYLLNALDHALTPVRRKGLKMDIRGAGLLAGVEFSDGGQPATKLCLALTTQLLKQGFIFLPEGEHSNVLGFTPPLIIPKRQLDRAVKAVAGGLKRRA